MPPRPVIIAVHQLGYGGVTNAVVDQARMFAEAGHPTTIATLTSEASGATRPQELRQEGRLHPDVKTVNLFTDTSLRQARESRGRHLPTAPLHRLVERVRDRKLLVETGEDQSGSYRRLFDPVGAVARFIRLDAEGRMVRDDRYRNDVVVRTDRYRNGVLVERLVFDESTGNKTQERYYTPDGFCYMVRWQSPRTGKGTGVFVMDRGGRRVKRYAGLPDWGAAWLTTIAREQTSRPVVLAESPSVVPKIAKIPRSVAARVGMMHNNQFAFPHTAGSAVRRDHEAVLASVEDLDALVVLTPQQRADLVDLVGHPDTIRVVPNTVARPVVEETTDARLVSIVSRLSAQKAVHEAIAAMSLVLDEVPEARLEIYGRGPDKERLEEVIAASGHGDRITLKGRTDQPAQAMARSLCTLSTSLWEAMPLSILESMAVGTPVVAYDCLYGPAALITDGETGRLVPQGDRRAFADAVIGLLLDPAAAERMGLAAREVAATRHSSAAVSRIWDELFSQLP